MIQLTSRGVAVVRGAAWEAAKRTFADRYVVELPQFVEDSLLDRLVRLVAKGEFSDSRHPTGSVASEMHPYAPVPRLFWMLLSRPVLFRAVQELVDAGPPELGRKDVVDRRIRSFEVGRCFKLVPGSDHHQCWHSDAERGRLVGFSVNLGEGTGGLEIRHESHQVAHSATPAFGSAVLFRIATCLTHRGFLGEGSAPRCAFSGWFSDHPDSLARALRRQAADLAVFPKRS